MRVGVVGVGRMGMNHLRVLASQHDVDVVGVVDVDKKQVDSVCKRFGVRRFSSVEQLCKKVDAVVVSSPTSTHMDVASRCIDGGCHVLVEKPLCDTIEDSCCLIELAEQVGVVLAVGHVERYNPVVRQVKQLMDDGRLGGLVSMCSRRVSRLDRVIDDVGVIFDLGIHDIDVMRFLNGDVKSVYAMGGKFNTSNYHENHACVMLGFDNGVYGLVITNWLTPMVIRQLCLTCSKGYVEVDYKNQCFRVSTSEFVDDGFDLYHTPLRHSSNEVVLQPQEPLRNEHQDFFRCVDSGGCPLVDGRDGMWAVNVACAAVRSYRSGAVVKLW